MNSGNVFYFTGGMIVYETLDRTSVIFSISPPDFMRLSLTPLISKSIDSTYLGLEDGALEDIAGNFIVTTTHQVAIIL